MLEMAPGKSDGSISSNHRLSGSMQPVLAIEDLQVMLSLSSVIGLAINFQITIMPLLLLVDIACFAAGKGGSTICFQGNAHSGAACQSRARLRVLNVCNGLASVRAS